MLDVLGCAIGCVFDGTADAGAARFGFCANGGDLLTPLGGLFFGILTSELGDLCALLFLSTSPLLGGQHFARTLDGIVWVSGACRILAVLAFTAVFAVALGLTSAGSATRIKPEKQNGHSQEPSGQVCLTSRIRPRTSVICVGMVINGLLRREIWQSYRCRI